MIYASEQEMELHKVWYMNVGLYLSAKGLGLSRIRELLQQNRPFIDSAFICGVDSRTAAQELLEA